jgi:hypothetical protein
MKKPVDPREIEWLEDGIVRLEEEIRALEAQIAKRWPPVRVKWATGENKILFLPVGRVHDNDLRSEFIVDQETADRLNAHREAVAAYGIACWLDLNHDWKTRIFSPITGFEFVEGSGVWAHGSWTPLGRGLCDFGRISGLSVNMIFLDGKSVNLAYPTEISATDAKRLTDPRAPLSETPNERIRLLAILGGVLTDGQKSGIQPYLTQTEQWKQILKQMDRSQSARIQNDRT